MKPMSIIQDSAAGNTNLVGRNEKAITSTSVATQLIHTSALSKSDAMAGKIVEIAKEATPAAIDINGMFPYATTGRMTGVISTMVITVSRRSGRILGPAG